MKLINNATTVADRYAQSATFDNISSNAVAPAYPQETINKATGYNKVRYLGGPFIIDSTDAAASWGSSPAPRSSGDNAAGALPGHIINFAPFRVAAACNYGTSIGGYVNIHRAKGIFTAPAPRAFTAAPPRVAPAGDRRSQRHHDRSRVPDRQHQIAEQARRLGGRDGRHPLA